MDRTELINVNRDRASRAKLLEPELRKVNYGWKIPWHLMMKWIARATSFCELQRKTCLFYVLISPR